MAQAESDRIWCAACVLSDGTFLVIESDQRKVEALMDAGVPVLCEMRRSRRVCVEAGVEHARGLATCLPDDADNVYVVLTARDLNPKYSHRRSCCGRAGGDLS